MREFGALCENAKASAQGVDSIRCDFTSWRQQHEADDARVHGDHHARIEILEKQADRAEDRSENTGQRRVAELEAGSRHKTTTFMSIMAVVVALLSALAAAVNTFRH